MPWFKSNPNDGWTTVTLGGGDRSDWQLYNKGSTQLSLLSSFHTLPPKYTQGCAVNIIIHYRETLQRRSLFASRPDANVTHQIQPTLLQLLGQIRISSGDNPVFPNGDVTLDAADLQPPHVYSRLMNGIDRMVMTSGKVIAGTLVHERAGSGINV